MKERYLLEDVSDNGFSLITDYDGNDEHAFDVNIKSGEILPVLPLRNMVLFPGVFLPITAGRKSSLKLIRDAEKKHKDIAVVCQRAAHTEDPKLEDLHNIGTVGRIVRVLEMPDQTTTVILQGMKRLSLKSITDTHPYLKGEVEILEEEIPGKDDKEFQALVETCKDLTMRYIKSSDAMHQDSAFAIKNINSPMFLINFICSNLPFKKDEKIDLLSIKSLRERTYHLLELLNREVQLAEIKASIQMRAREDIDQQQREYFLQQQIKTIQDELGGGGQEQEIEEMRNKAEKMHWNMEVKETFLKELAKLERTHPQSPDYSVQLNYLQTMLNLPWGIYTTDNLNLKNAEDCAISRVPLRWKYMPVSIDCDMEDLVEVAMRQNFVPVVDDRKMFIGIITRKDIIKYYYGKGTAGEKPQSSFIMAPNGKKETEQIEQV